jgi:hypothetical protein
VLLPARSPFFLASVGLVGLGGEENGWIFAWLCRLGPFRSRFWCPGDARTVEAAWLQWNNFLQALFHLAVICSSVGGELVRWESFGSRDRVGASDLDSSCLGVPAPYLSSAEMASASAWSPSVVTSGVIAVADSRYLLLILCAVRMEPVLLPWLGFVYQLAEKPGWCLVPTFYGGFVPLRVVSLSGESGLLAA